MKFIKYAVIIVFCLSLGVFVIAEGIDFLHRDLHGPEITSDRDVLEISCQYTQEDLLKGLKAYDEEDGDLTNQILAGSMTRFIDTGFCSVTYVVFDSSHQSASLTRNVRFTDYHSPKFSTTQALVFVEGNGNYQNTLSLIKAQDMLDGDITDAIAFGSSDVNYAKAGSYQTTFEVTNSYGDTSSMSFPVHIVKSENQTIQITLTEGVIYINAGDEINPYQWIESVETTSGRTLDKNSVSIDSQVQETPGIYEIHYSITSSGNKGETWLTVVVE